MVPPSKQTRDQPKLLPDEPILEKTGYELGELAEAPLKPPRIKKARRPKQQQWMVVIIGLTVAAIGLLAWPFFGIAFSIGAIIAGAVFVMIGTMLRL